MTGHMRQAIEALKLSDEEIGERLGVTGRTVRRWKQTGRVTKENRRNLARLLESQADRLQTWAAVLRGD